MTETLTNCSSIESLVQIAQGNAYLVSSILDCGHNLAHCVLHKGMTDHAKAFSIFWEFLDSCKCNAAKSVVQCKRTYNKFLLATVDTVESPTGGSKRLQIAKSTLLGQAMGSVEV